MKMSIIERKQIENEMIFRRANEKIGDDLDELDANLIEDGHPELTRASDLLLQIKCECSDEKCKDRIPIKLSVYRTIHENRNAFTIKPKHQIPDIEKVILTKDEYIVVLKNKSTAEPSNTLNKT